MTWAARPCSRIMRRCRVTLSPSQRRVGTPRRHWAAEELQSIWEALALGPGRFTGSDPVEALLVEAAALARQLNSCHLVSTHFALPCFRLPACLTYAHVLTKSASAVFQSSGHRPNAPAVAQFDDLSKVSSLQ